MILNRQCDGCQSKGEDVVPWGCDGQDYCDKCGLKEGLKQAKLKYTINRKHIHEVHISKLRHMRLRIRDLELELKSK